MSTLSTRDRELVSLGAALASNCVPCIEYHVPEARKAGLSDAEIAEAIQLAERIKRVPAAKVLETANALASGKGAQAAGGACCAPAEQSASADACCAPSGQAAASAGKACC